MSALAILLSVVTVHLSPHGPNGISGSATFTRVSGSATKVSLVLAVHDARPRPVHIHGGRCGMFFGLPFGKWTLRGARGSSIVHAPIAALLSGQYALDVHASPTSNAWIACANLRA